MFVTLGLKNAWRNRGRTALGIISMAVAAVIFMSSSTLSRGYPSGAYWKARQLLGGEIIMLPEKVALSTDTLASGGHSWVFEKRSYDRPNLVFGFDPTPYKFGGMRGIPIDGQDGSPNLDDVVDELLEIGFVKSAMVRQALPFLTEARQDDLSFYRYGFIEPRDVATDVETYNLDEAVMNGSYLQPGDLMTGVLCRWPYMSVGSGTPVEIPRFSGSLSDPEAGWAYDYENPVRTSLNIVGSASFSEPGPGAPTYANPVVFVTPETFQALRESAGVPESLTEWGISISIDNMADLESYVALLRRKYPDFTVYSAPQLAAASANRESVAAGVPMDMRRVTELLSFMIAALLSATNLSVLMLARKNEIGILRALGATRGNITSMVLAESVWIAFLGSLIGGLFTQPAIIWQLVSNEIASNIVVSTIATNMGKALGFSVIAAVLFGFLPVAKALRVTPAQVLRGE